MRKNRQHPIVTAKLKRVQILLAVIRALRLLCPRQIITHELLVGAYPFTPAAQVAPNLMEGFVFSIVELDGYWVTQGVNLNPILQVKLPDLRSFNPGTLHCKWQLHRVGIRPTASGEPHKICPCGQLPVKQEIGIDPCCGLCFYRSQPGFRPICTEDFGSIADRVLCRNSRSGAAQADREVVALEQRPIDDRVEEVRQCCRNSRPGVACLPIIGQGKSRRTPAGHVIRKSEPEGCLPFAVGLFSTEPGGVLKRFPRILTTSAALFVTSSIIFLFVGSIGLHISIMICPAVVAI